MGPSTLLLTDGYAAPYLGSEEARAQTQSPSPVRHSPREGAKHSHCESSINHIVTFVRVLYEHCQITLNCKNIISPIHIIMHKNAVEEAFSGC
jgi:hypothetical protein